jgi:hypothetical protein
MPKNKKPCLTVMDRASIVLLVPYMGRGLINFFSDVYYMLLYSEYSQFRRSQDNSFYKSYSLKSSESSVFQQLIAARDTADLSQLIIIEMRFLLMFDISMVTKWPWDINLKAPCGRG